MENVSINHCTVYRSTDLVDDETVAFWTEAANAYLREDVWPQWEKVIVGGPPNFEHHAKEIISRLAPSDFPVAALAILKSSDMDDMNGYHAVLGKVPFARSFVEGNKFPDRTFLHESGEIAINPFLDFWVQTGEGIELAVELNDPVQSQHYEKAITIFGKRFVVRCPNFVLPAYFEPGAEPPYDFLKTLNLPGTPTYGYQIARDVGTRDVYTFGMSKSSRFGADKLSPGSRTNQILRGVEVPRLRG